MGVCQELMVLLIKVNYIDKIINKIKVIPDLIKIKTFIKKFDRIKRKVI